MYIHLKWNNRNSNLDNVVIYRDQVELDPSNLPTPYATLSGTSSDYVDNEVERDVEYYYLIEFVRGVDRILSRQIKLKATVSSGPGPQDLIAGDYESGYFGLFSAEEFISASDINQHLNLFINNNYFPTHWIKYVYKGRICFIPYGHRSHPRTWSSLYQRGQVFGVEGPGPLSEIGNPSITPTSQMYTLDYSGYTFKVRLIDGGRYSDPGTSNNNTAPNYSVFPPYHHHYTQYTENEFDYCIRRILDFNEFSPYGKQLARLDPVKLFTSISGPTTLITQSLKIRGFDLSNITRLSFLYALNVYPNDYSRNIGGGAMFFHPLPVLELVS